MTDVIVGIDLGTTNSEVAAFVDGTVQVLAALVEGAVLARDRLDDALRRLEIMEIPCLGKPFDPTVMRAVDVAGTAAHTPGKPLMLAEYGLQEQPAGSPSKAEWFRDQLTQLKTTRTRIKALVYFNSLHNCDWRITSSSSSVAAYRDIGLDGFLNRLH